MPVPKDPATKLLQRLGRQLGNITHNPQPEDIHQFRTAARRVEALLEMLELEQDRNERKLLRRLSKARRRAGRVRDIDIQVAALRSLRMTDQRHARNNVLQTLSEMRDQREEKLFNFLDKEAIRDLQRRLKRAQEHLTEGTAQAPAHLRRLLSKFANQDGPINESVLHQCRVEGKKIRYIAELLEDSRDAQRIVEQFKHLQDILGEWHDWVTLNSTLLKLLTQVPNSPLLAAVGNVNRAKYREAVEAVSSLKAALLTSQTADVKSTGTLKREASGERAVATRAVA